MAAKLSRPITGTVPDTGWRVVRDIGWEGGSSRPPADTDPLGGEGVPSAAVRDPERAAHALTTDVAGSDVVRGARLAALQTGLLKAAASKGLRKILTFHSRTVEAEAMAAGVPEVAEQLHQEDPGLYPPVGRVWSEWLYAEHEPGHRRAVLEEFGSDVIEHEGGRQPEPAVLRVLSSVRVLGEGVDSRDCDGVFFCDTRGLMVDIVQMVGRALREAEGKIATLIVPVFLKEDEKPGDILTSSGAGMLSKVLEALSAHDTEAIEALADPRIRSGSWSDEEDGQDADNVPKVTRRAAAGRWECGSGRRRCWSSARHVTRRCWRSS